MKQPPKVIIIGAGLTGLTTAFQLKHRGLQIQLLEARNRVGGRIYTKYQEGRAPFELGATWLGMKHRHLTDLFKRLGIPIFPQYLGDLAIYEPMSTNPPQIAQLPKDPEPSYRIQGGSSALIQMLVNQLDEDDVLLNETVKRVEYHDGAFQIATEDQLIEADFVVSTLPPKLLVTNIEFSPALPEELLSIAQQTHTWMGESIKVGFTYTSPFWLSNGTSGTIFSNVGPVGEMYDHSTAEGDKHALKGFMNGAFYTVRREERKNLILTQLEKYFGDQVHSFDSYEECVWRAEPYTFTPYHTNVLPHQHNGHPLFRQPLFDQRFFIAGSETAADFPGYMDGAIQSGEFVAGEIIRHFG